MGYRYRQKVVSEVRGQYERVVADIQPDKDFVCADELVTWPSKNGLCYPVFQPQSLHGGGHAETRDISPSPSQSSCIQELKDRELVFKKDRDSLLEMKMKLSMELVWLKQAIASRQKVK